MSVVDKLQQIVGIINEIRAEDPGVADILTEGFGLSLNLMEALSTTPRENGAIDVSEHLNMITRVLGISLEDLVMSIVAQRNEGGMDDQSKQVDQSTLDFITTDLDDYEKFLAQNKAKDDIEFLAKSI